jgi:hypothetical protein
VLGKPEPVRVAPVARLVPVECKVAARKARKDYKAPRVLGKPEPVRLALVERKVAARKAALQ